MHGEGFTQTETTDEDLRARAARLDASTADFLVGMIDILDKRVDRLVADTPDRVSVLVAEHMKGGLDEDHVRWVKIMVEKQAQSVKLRQAVIEKSMVSLVFLLLGWFGLVVYDYMVKHGWKP
jgi:hypothetical protein